MQKIKSQASNNESHMRQSEEQRRNLETKRAQLEQQLKMFEAGQAGQVITNYKILSKRFVNLAWWRFHLLKAVDTIGNYSK